MQQLDASVVRRVRQLRELDVHGKQAPGQPRLLSDTHAVFPRVGQPQVSIDNFLTARLLVQGLPDDTSFLPLWNREAGGRERGLRPVAMASTELPAVARRLVPRILLASQYVGADELLILSGLDRKEKGRGKG